MSDENPFAAPSFVVSAVFLATVVVAGSVIVFWPDGDDDDVPPATAPSAEPTARSTQTGTDMADGSEEAMPASDGASVCGLEAHETEFEVLFPIQDTTWTSINGMRAPGTTEFGPGVVDDGARYCYARTPEGSVLATANFLVLANTGKEQMAGHWDRVIAPGPGRDPFVAELEGETAPADVLGQISAARVVSYTEEEARVSIAVAANEGLRASMTFDLEWSEGDWKIVVNDDGSSDASFTELDDLSGFTPWAAI